MINNKSLSSASVMVSNERAFGPFCFAQNSCKMPNMSQINTPANPNKVAVFIDNSNVFRNLHNLKIVDSSWVCFYNPLKLAQKLAGSRELVHVGFYMCSTTSLSFGRRRGWYQKIRNNIEILLGYREIISTTSG